MIEFPLFLAFFFAFNNVEAKDAKETVFGKLFLLREKKKEIIVSLSHMWSSDKLS